MGGGGVLDCIKSKLGKPWKTSQLQHFSVVSASVSDCRFLPWLLFMKDYRQVCFSVYHSNRRQAQILALVHDRPYLWFGQQALLLGVDPKTKLILLFFSLPTPSFFLGLLLECSVASERLAYPIIIRIPQQTASIVALHPQVLPKSIMPPLHTSAISFSRAAGCQS